MVFKNTKLYKECFKVSPYQHKIQFSHLPFQDGYYITEYGIILMVRFPSIYRLNDNGWEPAQQYFDLWYDSMTDFADISEKIAERLGLDRYPIKPYAPPSIQEEQNSLPLCSSTDNHEFILRLHSETGCISGIVSDDEGDKFHMSTLILPISDICIFSKSEQYHSIFDIDSTIVPGQKRTVIDSNGSVVAELIWKGSIYILKCLECEIELTAKDNSYYGSIGNTIVFSASLANDVFPVGAPTPDIYKAYRVYCSASLSEVLQICATFFPVLRFY